MNYDAIVIGAGPACSTCAYELSKRGLKALIVGKSHCLALNSARVVCLEESKLSLFLDGKHSF